MGKEEKKEGMRMRKCKGRKSGKRERWEEPVR